MQKALNSDAIPCGKARVLIAEDHPMNQMLMEKMLRKFGIGQIRIAEDGVSVLKACKETKWDVILMDCHMPEKNGYEATKDIRIMEKTTGEHVPIIAITANAMARDKEKCLRHGMDEYINKPVDANRLKEILSRWIDFKDGNASQQRTHDDVPINLTQLKTIINDDKDAEREFIMAFVRQSDKNIRALQENCVSGESRAWAEAAHMFKGGASGIGAAELDHLCDRAQQMFLGTEDERAAVLKKIETEYAKIKDYLREMGLLS